MNDMRGLLAPGTRKNYVLAGNATITIKSCKTETRFTYKVVKHETLNIWFVKLLNGPENNTNYVYIGMIGDRGFSWTKKSRVSTEAPSFIAFSWFFKNIEDARMEVWHEGSCGRCGRKLTVPESIAQGIGPTCAGYAA